MTENKTPKNHLLFCLLMSLVLCLSVTGCSTFNSWFKGDSPEGEAHEPPPEDSPELLLSEGMEAYNVGNYYKASTKFEKILDTHPFSEQALQAELKAADAHYYNKSYEEAKSLYEGFEEHYPANKAIPYVLFQIGMCDYSRTNRIDKDVSGARDSIRSFSRLLRSYPDSPYAQEAKARIHLAKEFLVNHEYYIAVFFVRKHKYEQAQHRLKYLIAMYPEAEITPRAKELLKRLDEGNPPRWGLSKWLPDAVIPSSWQ